MPKTLASKKTMQQKKRLLGEDDGKVTVPFCLPCSYSTPHSETASGDHFSNDIPTKTGKLSNQDDELKKSTHRRPRCQASCVNEFLIHNDPRPFK